jgi:hypothetical protein
MIDKECPAEPVVGDDGSARGGFAKAAEILNGLFPNRPRPISRQLVHKWWLYRHFNGFPAAIDISGSGKGRPVFDLDAVAAWYVSYRRHRGAPGNQEQTIRTTAGTPTADGKDTLAA